MCCSVLITCCKTSLPSFSCLLNPVASVRFHFQNQEEELKRFLFHQQRLLKTKQTRIKLKDFYLCFSKASVRPAALYVHLMAVQHERVWILSRTTSDSPNRAPSDEHKDRSSTNTQRKALPVSPSNITVINLISQIIISSAQDLFHKRGNAVKETIRRCW